MAGYNIQLLLMCALGCGATLGNGNSGISSHGDEVSYIFVSWLSKAIVGHIRFWKTCRQLRPHTFAFVTMSRVRCHTLKYVTLDNLFLQIVHRLQPINFATWAELHCMPHVFELKRPSKSDPEDVMGLSMWWYNYTPSS